MAEDKQTTRLEDAVPALWTAGKDTYDIALKLHTDEQIVVGVLHRWMDARWVEKQKAANG